MLRRENLQMLAQKHMYNIHLSKNEVWRLDKSYWVALEQQDSSTSLPSKQEGWKCSQHKRIKTHFMKKFAR